MAHAPRTARPGASRVALLLATTALVPGLAACGGDDETTTSAAAPATSTTAPPATTTTEAPPAATCKPVKAPKPRAEEPELPKPRPARLKGTWDVTMVTNCGTFTIRLDTKRQPKTAASFKSLVAAKFYDGLTFHRIVADYVIQGGDPLGTGIGGPGYFVREDPPADARYTRGVVAMAKGTDQAPGTSGSQFYVVTGADTGLPPEYAIVGAVTDGMEAVDAISAVGSSGPPEDRALAPVVIEKATAEKG